MGTIGSEGKVAPAVIRVSRRRLWRAGRWCVNPGVNCFFSTDPA